MNFDYQAVENIIGHTFLDKSLLLQAFTHPSFSNEHKSYASYERLEFLGDSVLGFIVAETLFSSKDWREGKLTARKAELVSTYPLSTAMNLLGLEKYIVFGKGEITSKSKVAENVFEALTAAIYLDGGIEKARAFVKESLQTVAARPLKDYKSIIKIYADKNKLGEVSYPLTARSGPDHAPTFTVKLVIGDNELSIGEGKSKKEAEQAAAALAVENLEKEGIELEF